MYQVDLNLLVGVMTFTFSPLHCFYATIVEGGAADRRRRPILVSDTRLYSPIELYFVCRSSIGMLVPKRAGHSRNTTGQGISRLVGVNAQLAYE